LAFHRSAVSLTDGLGSISAPDGTAGASAGEARAAPEELADQADARSAVCD
jgi:hypothetical protein